LPPPEAVTDLVWLATGFIGDLVLATAAMDVAAKHFPNVRQHVVTTPVGAVVLAGAPGLSSLTVFDKRAGQLRPMLAARRQLRAALAGSESGSSGVRNVVLLQPHLSFRSSLLARLTRLPTVTFEETVGGGHAAVRVPRVAVLHEAARIALLLEPLGVARDEAFAARPRLAALPLRPDVPWQATVAAQRKCGGAVIAIAPGSVWGTKRWPSERYAEVAVRLVKEHPDALVVLLGSPAEKKATSIVARAVVAALPNGDADHPRLLDLAGTTSLEDLRRLFPEISVLIANDSSPVHYAAAFNVPTVAVFGATVPAMGFGPLADRSVVVQVEGLPCRPCGAHGPMTCPLTHFRCMRDLSAASVFDAASSLLR
jgi:heptosyltransferase-2